MWVLNADISRATSEGNHTIVTELLASGYRNLGAKDPDSRTALHLAVIHKQVHLHIQMHTHIQIRIQT